MNRPFRLPNAALDKALARHLAVGSLPRGYIDGLIVANDASDVTNDVSISAGVCRSTHNIVDGEVSTLTRDQIDLELPATIIKQLDVAWRPSNYDGTGRDGGTRSGVRSASAIANGTWPLFVMGGRDVQTDVFAHDGMTPTLPAGYTAYRHIHSLVRSGGALREFVQAGDYVSWNTPVAESFNGTNPGTGPTSRVLTVPLGIVVEAEFDVFMIDAGSGAVNAVFTALDTTSVAIGTNNVSLAIDGSSTAAGRFRVKTNTAGEIRTAFSASSANLTFNVRTRGYFFRRGRDS